MVKDSPPLCGGRVIRCITRCITKDSQNRGWARNETGTGFEGEG